VARLRSWQAKSSGKHAHGCKFDLICLLLPIDKEEEYRSKKICMHCTAVALVGGPLAVVEGVVFRSVPLYAIYATMLPLSHSLVVRLPSWQAKSSGSTSSFQRSKHALVKCDTNCLLIDKEKEAARKLMVCLGKFQASFTNGGA
jgi:hypothetical protein